MSDSRPDLRALAPLATVLIWGVNIPVMKGAVGVLHPFAFNTLRLTLTVVFLGWLVQRERAAEAERGAPAPPPTPWGLVALLALTAGFVYQLFFLGGMGLTSAGHTSVLIGSSPLWTALLARWSGQEAHGRAAWAGLLVAFLGTTLVVADGTGGATLAGDALVLGAALTWALGAILSKRALEHMSSLRLAFLYAALALPAHWLVAAPLLDTAQLAAAPPAFWAAVVYSGVLSTGVAYVLWNVGLRAIGAARTAIYVNLVPVLATLLAWAFLDEGLGALQLLGTTLVIGGLVAVQRARVPESA